MKIGDSLRYQLYETALSNVKSQMDQTSEEVASGEKVQVPSDNPSSYAQNMQVQTDLSQNTQYKSNLDSLQATGSYTDTALNSVSNIVSTAQQLAVETASSTSDASARQAAATQVDDLIQQLVTLGNTKVGDTYIFGGTRSNNPAYTMTTDPTTGTPVVTFAGSATVGQVAVTASTTMDAGISGQTIFTGTADGQPVDIFATLEQFSDDLKNTSGAMSSDQQITALQTDLGNINNCADLTANNLSYVGSYNKNISNLLAANSNADTTLNAESSNLIGVDMAQAISDYTNLSTAYQAALYTMSKVESINILQYLPA